MITLYGIANSRAFRCLWLLEESGVAYEHVPLDFAGDDLRADAFAKLNPNRRIPCLVDGDLRLFESLAINLYLARRYAPALWPDGVENEARAYQWTLWAANELEPHLSLIAFQRNRVSAAERDHAAIGIAEDALAGPLEVLNAALSRARSLAGSAFTVADLNVASVLATAVPIGFDFSGFGHVSDWFRACLGRPAGRRATAMTRA